MTEKDATAATASSTGCDLGWNDPPMFSYESHLQYAHVRGPTLTKRVGLSWDSSPSKTPSTLSTSSSSSPPVCTSSSPPKCSAPPLSSKFPKPSSTRPSTADALPSANSSVDNVDNAEKEATLADVAAGFAEAVNELYGEDKEKEKTEINKRLQLIESMWEEDKLFPEIRQKLGRIVKALNEGKVDECDALQRSLMVDHPSVCSPWMAAIRKLMSAKRDKSTA